MSNLGDIVGDNIIGLATGLLVAGFIAYIGREGAAEIIRSYRSAFNEATIQVQTSDLNNNGLPEGYIVVNGEKYYSAIDGKSIKDILNR